MSTKSKKHQLLPLAINPKETPQPYRNPAADVPDFPPSEPIPPPPEAVKTPGEVQAELIPVIEKQMEVVAKAIANFKIGESEIRAKAKKIKVFMGELYSTDLHPETDVDDFFRRYEADMAKYRLTSGVLPFGEVTHKKVQGLKQEWDALADTRTGDYYKKGPVSTLLHYAKEAEKDLLTLSQKLACNRSAEIRTLYEKYRLEIAEYLLVLNEGNKDISFGMARLPLSMLKLDDRAIDVLSSAGLDPVVFARRVIFECRTPLPEPFDLRFPRVTNSQNNLN